MSTRRRVRGDGQQWTSAFTDLQAALDLARLTGGVSEIRVAQGLYLPDGGTGDASLAFELVSGVRHIGGFATGGGAWNPEQFVTVLSGDLLGNDGPPGPGVHRAVAGKLESRGARHGAGGGDYV
ncbi:MAG: hypothetical protein R3E96_10745 [Planctomycetota bacterium]